MKDKLKRLLDVIDLNFKLKKATTISGRFKYKYNVMKKDNQFLIKEIASTLDDRAKLVMELTKVSDRCKYYETEYDKLRKANKEQ